jgi:FtsP/CotA-like multicopper oxidase with cupredoxin domain
MQSKTKEIIFIRLIFFFLLFYNNYMIEMALVEYNFTIRSIPSNPDGYPRPVIIMHYANSSWDVDRPFPCPLIRAKLGDQLRIHITNMLREQSTAIHFHGLHMINNPWADGTVHITQCSIEPYDTFIYEFHITQTGTFWYHSHNAQQYADGLIGPIIIDHDTIEQQYNYGLNDYIIMLQEWSHETWPILMTAYRGPHGAYRGNIPIYPWPPTSFLINGHGQFDCRTSDCSENNTWQDSCGQRHPAQCIPLRSSFFGPCKSNAHPIDEFLCPPGKQIRIRLINAASGIPFRFWIDQHNLTIVARDSIEIAPIIVPHVHIPIGQRLDLIIDCNQDPTVKYTIFAASRNSYQPPNNITGPTPTMWTWALLIYSTLHVESRATHIPAEPVLNSDDPFFEYDYLKPLKPRFAPAAIRRTTLAFEVYWNNRTGIDALEEWAVNGITFEPPKEPILHGNFFDGTFEHCVATERDGLVNNIHATHIQHFEYGKTYEILMINYDPQLHPWHLHGYSVDFIAAGKIPTLAPITCNRTRRDANRFDYSTILPPLNSTPLVLSVGDSFNIPRESYVVFRFTANNPGPWFVHCHMEWHIWPGMAIVFSVERNGRYEGLIQPPPSSFPICGRRKTMSYKSSLPFVSSAIRTEPVIYLLAVFIIGTYFSISKV